MVQVENEGSNIAEVWALTKGAPEVIKEFLGSAPSDYDVSYRQYAAQGGRWDALSQFHSHQIIKNTLHEL